MDEAVGVSKKAKVDPKIEEDASSGFGKCDTNAHSNEIEALDERLKQTIFMGPSTSTGQGK
ncbi:hypothetical protein JHK82_012434 [Glycine max]|nr:hypothetical protein JHK82_012434 [Glycine max]